MTADLRWPGPLFVVGPSRSGTTMMQSVLSSHPRVALAPETHYFDDLRPRTGGGPLAAMTPENRDRCLDYFRALASRPYGKGGDAARSPLSRDELLARANALGGTADAAFEAFCRMRGARGRETEAAIWGEKTPRHVFRLAEIFAAFPEARALAMIRDPRAAVVSYRDWQYRGGYGDLENRPGFQAALEADYRRAQLSYHIVLSTLMWRATVNAAYDAAARFGPERVRLLRYEDFVAAPQDELAAVCAWIGVEPDPVMLEVPLHNSSTAGFAPRAGVSADPMERWRDKLDPRETGIIQRVAGRTLARAGYTAVPGAGSALDLARAYAELPAVVLRATRANHARVGNLPVYAWRRFRAAMK
jgi:hypothetical protein